MFAFLVRVPCSFHKELKFYLGVMVNSDPTISSLLSTSCSFSIAEYFFYTWF